MSESKAATQEQLWELWQAVLDELMRYFKETPQGKSKAAYLAVAVRFLEANRIALDASELRDVRKSLSELRGLSLPFSTNPPSDKEH